jgi:C4-dicarboxylate-specific signal transduction histidine kinase
VDHIHQVVQAQHAFARKMSHAEPTDLRELVDSALTIMEAAFTRHGIVWRAGLEPAPTILLDAAKCLQVLVNLLTNAKEALGATPRDEKRIDTRLRRVAGDTLAVEVRDNGCGVASDDLERIFANGFTTKSGGRGFGLHYCALAARELGGELAASSEGLGRGACFTLRLPVRVVAEAQAR